MLDLKAKLAAAGLVSAADVAAAERKDRKPGPRDHAGPRNHSATGNRSTGTNPGNHSAAGNRSAARNNAGPRERAGQPARPGLDVVALKRAGKGEGYDAIRRAVDRGRLDPVRAIPGEAATAFHFMTATGQLSRLMLEPDVHLQLAAGTAGIIAFMSHHGLAHSVVARPLAEAVAEVFPLWLRVLKDHPGAGQLEPPKPPPADPEPATPTASAEPGSDPPTDPTDPAEPTDPPATS